MVYSPKMTLAFIVSQTIHVLERYFLCRGYLKEPCHKSFLDQQSMQKHLLQLPGFLKKFKPKVLGTPNF